MPDLGVARGVVRVEYQSAGAAKIQRETESVVKYTDRARTSFSNLAEKAGLSSAELAKFQEVSKRVGRSTEEFTKIQDKMAAAVSGAAKMSPKEFTNLIKEQREAKNALEDTTVTYEKWLKTISHKTNGLTFDGRQFAVQGALQRTTTAISQWATQNTSLFARMGTNFGHSLGGGMLGGIMSSMGTFTGTIATGLNRLKGMMADIGSNLGANLVSGLTQRAGSLLAGVGQALGTVLGKGAKIGVFAAITAAATTASAAVASLGAAIGLGFGRLASIDAATIKLGALGLKAAEVESVVKSANDAVLQTSYGLEEAFTVAADAINANIKPGKQLDDYLKAVANTASLANTSMYHMGEIFNQIATQGKLDGMNLMRLYRAQVPVLKLVGEEYGVTQARARQMVSEGRVKMDDFVRSMLRTGDAAKIMGNTIGSSFGNLRAAIARIGASLLAPLFAKDDVTGASMIAKAIQGLTELVDRLGRNIKENSDTVADFWRILAKGAMGTAKVVSTTLQVIVTGVMDLVEGLADAGGWVLQFGAKAAEVFGAKGVAQNLRNTAQSFHSFGEGARRNLDNMIAKFNELYDGSWESLNKLSDAFKKAAKEQKELASSSDPKPVLSVVEALQELEVQVDTVTSGIKGSTAEFQKMLEALRKKGAGDDLLQTIKRMRDEYQNTGRQADTLAKAIDAVNDASQDAGSSSAALIQSLRDIGALAGNAEQALSSYNETIAALYDPNNNFVNILDDTGRVLIDVNGSISQASENGRRLWKETDTLVKSMGALMAQGANVEDTYANTSKAFRDLLAQFGIFGTDADRLTEKYFGTPETWVVQMQLKNKTEVQKALAQIDAEIEAAKRKGQDDLTFKVNIDEMDAGALKDTIEKLGGVWKEYNPLTGQATIDFNKANLSEFKKEILDASKMDPAKYSTELQLKTTRQDLVDQVAPDNNPLRIATVLDVEKLNLPDGVTLKADEDKSAAPEPPKPTPYKDLPLPTNTPPPGAANRADDPFKLPPEFDSKPTPFQSGQTPKGVAGSAGDPFAVPELKDSVEEQAVDISGVMNDLITKAASQGQSLSEAYADGIANGSEDVKRALLELAQLAPDILGNSPAKYGPLSGRGWTLERGKNFSRAFATGISSEASTVRGSVETLAQYGTMPLDDGIARLLGDLKELSDFGKRVSDLVSSLFNISMSVAKLFLGNTKTYVKDKNAKPQATGMGLLGNVFGGAAARGYQNLADAGQTPSGLQGFKASARPATREEAAKAVIAEAQRRGLNKEQTLAALGVLGQESDYGQNPAAYRPQTQNGTSGILGPFQQDNSYAKYGDRTDINVAAQGFIDQFIKRGEGLDNPNPWQQALKVQVPATPADGGYDDKTGLMLRENQRARAEALYNSIVGAAVDADTDITNRLPQGAITSRASGNVFTQLPDLYGLDKGTSINYGEKGFPPWVYEVAKVFGLEASTYATHQETKATGGSEAGVPMRPNPQERNRGIDWRGSPEAMERFAKFLRENGLAEQVIYQNPKSKEKVGFPEYADYNAWYPGHQDHVHTRFSQGFMPGDVDISRFIKQDGTLPVSLPSSDSRALQNQTLSLDTLPAKLGDYLKADPQTLRAFQASRGLAGGRLGDQEVVGLLQHLDSQITKQQQIGTPVSNELARNLSGIRSNLMSQYQMTEGPDLAGTVGDIFGGAAGLVRDGFAIYDSVLKSIGSTHEIAKQLNRGFANTEDVNKTIDNIQSYIELAGNIATTVSDGLGLASMITGAAAAGDPSGGASGAAAALGIASTISSVVSQAIMAVNAFIDIGQELWRMGMKYSTRGLLNWMGLPGASDMNYLLESKTGQLKAWTSENPNDKRIFNTLGNTLTGNPAPVERVRPLNQFSIYQGPGQDYRDTMNDAMFMVRSAGAGVFDYA